MTETVKNLTEYEKGGGGPSEDTAGFRVVVKEVLERFPKTLERERLRFRCGKVEILEWFSRDSTLDNRGL
jgi:hypothetical protein